MCACLSASCVLIHCRAYLRGLRLLCARAILVMLEVAISKLDQDLVQNILYSSSNSLRQ